ncbi:hypothetical protein MRX96_009205 [Rhipicephalus microplus]
MAEGEAVVLHWTATGGRFGGRNANGQVSRANGQVSGANGQVSRANGQVSRANGQVSRANGQVSRANGQVSRANGQVSRANGQVSRANGQVSRANGQVSRANGQVSRANGQVSRANGQVSRANGQVSRGNGQVSRANGAPAQASFAQAVSKKVGIVAAVPPFSTQLRPNATAAAIVPPTLTMNGVSHGVVVGATANGPPCVAPTEEGSIHDSSPLPPVPSDVHPNGICGPRQRSSDELHLQEIQKTLPSHFPRRPTQGKLGRPIQLMANHFSVEMPAGNIYHDDVGIFSENNKEAKIPEKRKHRCISTKINRLVIELLVKKYRLDLSNCVPAFDGRKNFYTRQELKFGERTFAVDLEEDQRVQKFVVKIQYAATVNLDALHAVFENQVNTVPQEVLQAIDIVLRHGPSIRLTPVGRSFFKPPLPNQAHSVGGGREVWFGYYTSVRPAQWKPMLNVDMSATAFYEPQPVISFMCKILSDGRRKMTVADFSDLRDFQNVRLNKELKGLRIKKSTPL